MLPDNLSSLSVLVDDRLIADAASAVRVAQRRHGLVQIVVRWTDARHHQRQRIAAETV